MKYKALLLALILVYAISLQISSVYACDGSFIIAPHGSVISALYLLRYFYPLLYPLITFLFVFFYVLRFRKNYGAVLTIFALNSLFFYLMTIQIDPKASGGCSFEGPALRGVLDCYRKGRFPVAKNYWHGYSGGTDSVCMTSDLGKRCSSDNDCESICLQAPDFDENFGRHSEVLHKSLVSSLYGKISRFFGDNSTNEEIESTGFCAAFDLPVEKSQRAGLNNWYQQLLANTIQTSSRTSDQQKLLPHDFPIDPKDGVPGLNLGKSTLSDLVSLIGPPDRLASLTPENAVFTYSSLGISVRINMLGSSPVIDVIHFYPRIPRLIRLRGEPIILGATSFQSLEGSPFLKCEVQEYYSSEHHIECTPDKQFPNLVFQGFEWGQWTNDRSLQKLMRVEVSAAQNSSS